MSDFDRNYNQKPIYTNILRQLKKSYKHKASRSAYQMKRRKDLRKMLESNINIFQISGHKNYSRKFVQKVIWQKNYSQKMKINILKDQNSSLKAKLWNIQKQNRKMDKQIQSWNLVSIFESIPNKKKPYIDTMTVLKVLDDQDYKIVSMKIQIAKLQAQLQGRQQRIQLLQDNEKYIQKYDAHMSYILNQHKQIGFYALNQLQQIDQNKLYSKNLQQSTKASELQCSKQINTKNLQFKIKSNLNLQKQIEHVNRLHHQLICQKTVNSTQNIIINQEQIQKIKQQTRKIKLQQRDNLKQTNKSLHYTKKSRQAYQCYIQQRMANYIQKKIQLRKECTQICDKINQQFNESERNEQYFQKNIVPIIRQFV